MKFETKENLKKYLLYVGLVAAKLALVFVLLLEMLGLELNNLRLA